MSIIYLIFTILLICINLIGITLALRPYISHYPLAKVIGVIGLCLLGFFLEHFIGLGQLTWLWPITSAGSIFLIYRQRDAFITRLWRQEIVFIIGILFYVCWKYTFPDIDPHSEQLGDLSFIVSYLQGHRLPSLDYWDPHQPLNIYYSFQYYAAALMGRVFHLSPGLTMNLAYAILMALLLSLCWFIVSHYAKPYWIRILMVIAVMAGGTGIAPMTHLIFKQAKPAQDLASLAQQDVWANTRFIGVYDKAVNTALGKSLFHPKAHEQPELDLPLETLGYLTVLGDFHPPLGGFLLLFLALACLSVLDTTEDKTTRALLQGVIAASVPLALVTNSWVFPLQALLVLAWVGHRYFSRRPIDWRAMLAGLFISLFCLYPFLSYFAPHALHPHIKWVTLAEHTPWDRYLAVHWPELVLLALAAIGLRKDHNKFWLVMVLAVLMLGSELLYVDDNMRGQYLRFNSTLKWWSWIYPAIVLMLGSWLLALGRWYRGITVVVLLLISLYSLDLLTYWYAAPKRSVGKLNGYYWLSHDPGNRAILQWLNAMPKGVVLENIGARGSYISTSAFALFSRKPSAVGWPDHETQWRHNLGIIYRNADNDRRFYHGQLKNPIGWLDFNAVDYIVWTDLDQQQAPLAWQQVDAQIRSQFHWLGFINQAKYRAGIWYRMPQHH